MAYTTEERGQEYTTSYNVFLRKDGQLISPFHDIPCFADQAKKIYNMVVEIPRWSNAKMEISTKSHMNPIKQDVKKGKVRFVHNLFPHKGYIWNYGAIPQTWENPSHIDQNTGQKGDGDPIDVVEIGEKIAKRGEVKQIKALGVLALIDEGETDWKVVAIDVNDPLASDLNDIDDVRAKMPGLLEATYDWLKFYKTPGGSQPNEFAFEGQVKDRSFTEDIILETHDQWKQLVTKTIENEHSISCGNVAVENSPYHIDQQTAESGLNGLDAYQAPAAIPGEVDKVHYIDRKTFS